MKLPTPRSLLRRLATACAALGTAWSVQAADVTFDFNTDPSGILTIVGNRTEEVWRATGGNPGGYLSITDAGGSQYSGILFDDFDAGLVVASFDFEADFRVGNGTTDRPADGFSVSLAREGDPLIEVMESLSGATGAFAGGIPEGGSTTGLAVSFDTWAGNTLPDGPDIEGIIVRVDNRTLIRESLPTRHGACDDVTSLQTGPRVANDSGEFDGDPSGLCWQKFTASLSEDSRLTVTWKGRLILDAVSIAYNPSRSRLIFAGRTGGANENHHVDNVRIVTRPANRPVIGGLAALASELTLSITDSGTTVNPATIQVQLNGAPTTPASQTTVDGVTTLRLTPPAGMLFPSGSTQTVFVSFQDNTGFAIEATRSATVLPYSTIPADYRLASATQPGFNFRIFQLEVARGPGNANSIVNGENNLAGSFRDPATGLPYENVAAERSVVALDMINLNQDAPGAAGNFTFNNGYEDMPVPGIPGDTGSTDNYAAEIWAYLSLQPGYYRMGVNSDDGFTVSTWGNAPDPFGQRLGFFDGGRGASDTLFDFAISEAGFYPFRLSWWEGGGGSNAEWFMVNVSTGEKILINDTIPGSIQAFRTASGRAFVRTISPYPGFANAQPNQGLRAELVNGTTTFSDIQLTVDGSPVTPTISGGVVTWNPASPLAFGSTHTAVLSYQESGQAERRSITIPWTVRKLAPFDLPGPPDSFWIEAEDYNSNGLNPVSESNTMPYTGGGFNDLPAFVGIDYNNNDGNDSDLYRTTAAGGTDTAPNNVNMNDNINGRWGRERPGNNEVFVNYKIGWVTDGDWQNYTRTVPNGIYTAVAALSYDGTAANQLRGSLARVTSNPAQANQTTVPLGSFSAPGSGGWGPNDLVPMTGFAGRPAFFKVTSQPTTFRFNLGSGDFDYFILVRTSAPPAVVNASPAPGSEVPRNKASINIQLEDMATSVNQASLRLSLNGTDVTGDASISKSGDVTTVAYNIPQAPLGQHTYMLTWTDSNGRADSLTGTFSANVLGTPGQFLVEAEDFNYDGGQTLPIASVMPYLGLAYSNLNAVINVDYGSNDGNDSRNYRTTLEPNKNMNENNSFGGRNMRDRGLWEVTLNYKLGWVDTADFGNYTRTIPAGNYNVWAALSHGNAAGDPNQLRGTLAMVGGDITTTDQTLAPLGTFNGPATGGWGANALVPMMNGDSMAVVTSTGAPATYRFTMDSGDFDYFLFVPSEGGPADPPVITSITASGGNVTITWIGGGTLEVADNVTGPWVDTGLSSPVTAPNDRATRYGRIRR